MSKLNGGIIGPDNVPTGAFGSASGVWSLSDVTNYKKQGTWPIALTGHQVDNSLRFDDGSSDYLNRTPASAGNRKTNTLSAWVKRSNIVNATIASCYSAGNNNDNISITLRNNGELRVVAYAVNWRITNRLFRDTSAWYHIVIAIDTTQATANDRIKVYVNGVQETSFSTINNPSQNDDIGFNQASTTRIGVQSDTLANYFDGYMAEVIFIDGQALDPTSFGETDSVTNNWVPKDVSGLTFGTNGFYLDFKDSSALGNDAAGSNNFTVNNLTSIDQSTDTCTNNFATLNALTKNTSRGTLSNGNLTYVATDTNWSAIPSTLGVSSGKWYAEFKFSSSTGGDLNIGVVDEASLYNVISSGTGASDFYMGKTTGSYGYFNNNGNKVNNASSVSYGDTWTNDDVISVALNMDDGEITFYKNGVSQGVAYTGLSGTYFIGLSTYRTGNANFGNPSFSISSGNTDSSGMGNFEYAVPSGYYSLCTRNLNLIG